MILTACLSRSSVACHLGPFWSTEDSDCWLMPIRAARSALLSFAISSGHLRSAVT
jgi:hypothetical protein